MINERILAMMGKSVAAITPSFVAAGTIAHGGGTVPLPAGHTAGDLLVICGVAGNSTGYSAPSGWGTAFVNNGTYKLACFYKIDGGSESAPTLSGGNGADQAVMLCYRGVTALDVAGTYVSNTSTSMTFSTLTTAVGNEILIYVQGYNGNGTYTQDAATNLRYTEHAGTYYALAVSDELKVSAGASTARTMTHVGTTVQDGNLAAFKP